MGRRVTVGQYPITSTQLFINEGNISSPNSEGAIDFSLDGIVIGKSTGKIELITNTEIDNGSELHFYDAANTGYAGFKAPATVGTSVTYTLPDSDGAKSGQALTTDALGTLSWRDVVVESDIDSTTSDELPVYFGDTATADATGSANISILYRETNSFSYNPSADRLTITNLSAGSITETSSLVFKENINPITDALDKILGLDGVTFKRKATGKLEAGLIAEDVEKVLPEIVSNNKFDNTQSIAYSRLTAYLIEAIKTLSQEIERLKK